MCSVNFSVIFTKQRKHSQFFLRLFFFFLFTLYTDLHPSLENLLAILRLEHTLRHQEYISEREAFIVERLTYSKLFTANAVEERKEKTDKEQNLFLQESQ